jgi:hypothetical protein
MCVSPTKKKQKKKIKKVDKEKKSAKITTNRQQFFTHVAHKNFLRRCGNVGAVALANACACLCPMPAGPWPMRAAVNVETKSKRLWI